VDQGLAQLVEALIMGMLTDYGARAYSYVQLRKTPPSVAEVALHLMTSRQNAHRILTNLVRKGMLKSFMEKPAKQRHERRYCMPGALPVAAKLSPLKDKGPPKPAGRPRTKEKIKEMSFFNDPFNMTKVRDEPRL
jgi:hypothetical protein